jgi:hypothetical protein
MKRVRIFIACLILLIIIIALFITYKFVFTDKATVNTTNMKTGEYLVLSSYKKTAKSDLWLIHTSNGKPELLLENRDVMVSGKINTRGDLLIYSDAIGQGNWDIYMLNRKANKIFQLTDDKTGQFNLKFGDENGQLIFAKAGGIKSPIPQIARFQIDKEKADVLPIKYANNAVKDFDVYNSKIIAIAYSLEKEMERHNKKNENNLPDLPAMDYSIVQMDFNGENEKEIMKINAIALDSITWSANGDFVVFGANGINNKKETGFYKLNLKTKRITELLSEGSIKKADNDIGNVSHPFISCLTADQRKIYFISTKKDSQLTDFSGLQAYPNSLYLFDLEKNEVKEVFSVKDTVVSDVSITYHK